MSLANGSAATDHATIVTELTWDHQRAAESVERTSQHILLYRRFIDDGFLLWKGPRFAAEQFLHHINNFRHNNFSITWEISGDSTIFLDLKTLLEKVLVG